MRLKRIVIVGFKSFADKTRLDFDAGITAVVGPNGCGKSNIADAFRWVMGEQSAKSMRGTKMPDVIFAGTTNRKPLNYAEVTITLTDVGEQLPIDYDEVEITRRLHRNGESEYFINRHPVRLKDVHSLLLDSGLGKDAYSIFEQGEIDRVINLPPLERRHIFEEAAGIQRFLQRKKEALRKLEQTDQNVDRVKDIHKEVERHIIVLEEQAEKARQHKEDKRHLEELERHLIVTRWEAFQSKSKDIQQKARDQEGQIASTNAHIESLQEEFKGSKEALAQAETSLKHQREEVFKARSTKEIKSKEKQTNEERVKENSAKEARWKQELKNMDDRRKQREKERVDLLKNHVDVEKRCTELQAVVEAQRVKVKSLEDDVNKQREQQQVKQKETFKLVQTESQCESEIRQISVRLEGARERQNQMEARKEKLAIAIAEFQRQVEEKQVLIDESARSLEGQKGIFSAMENDLQCLTEEGERTQENIDKVQQEIVESRARQKTFERLRQEMEGFSAGGKQLLQEAANERSPFFNKIRGLYEYFIPEKGAEEALAVAMKPYAQTLAVDTEDDFEAVVAYAKQNQIKDISLLCLEGISVQKAAKLSGKAPKGLSSLSSHVAENELSGHFLKGIYIDKEGGTFLDTIRNHAGIEIWKEGAFIDNKSVVFFASEGENNVFMREAELKALEKKLREGEMEKQQLDAISQAIQQKKRALQAERVELDKTIRRAEMRLVELNFSFQKINGDIESARAEEKQLVHELNTIGKTMANLTASLEDLQNRFGKIKELAINSQQLSDSLHKQLELLVGTAKIQSNDLRDKEAAFKQTSDELRKLAHALHVLEVKDSESQQQEQRLLEEIELGKTLQSQMSQKGSEVEKLLFEIEHVLASVVTACSDQEKQVIQIKTSIDKLESKINDKRNALRKFEGDRNQSGIQIAQIDSQLQTLVNELQERHKLSMEEAKSCLPPLSYPAEQLDKQIRALRQKVEGAGDINMMSIEECDKHKVRYDFLNQQLDDLNVSRQDLVSIITQLDEESRKIFQETFAKIKANFKKNFQILFNGGDADLEFTETSDVLEAGIEIIAKPPGKQMRSINLLSGGEKCLTAMALLFAIFEVKPAPFCILDEIDAPLDDTNVERFVAIVKEFVDRCQFIIITHNKRTMAIADILFGVSMEERGVSKLLTMDFAHTG